LGREPENDAAVAAHVGGDILALATNLVASEEHRNLMRAVRAEDVIRLYREILGREPENDATVAAHVGRPLFDVAMDFAHSDEFRARARRAIPAQEIQEFCALFLGSFADDTWIIELAQILRFHQISIVALMDNLLRMHLRRRGIAAADDTWRLDHKPPYIHLREQPDYMPTRHFGTRITLVVPTVNSENWIRHLAEFYDTTGIKPLYAVDSRTTDSTREILAGRGDRWIEVTAEAERVEALLPAILRKVDTPWVLRLDDDELPSPELLRFADETADGETADGAEAPVWGFPRLSLRWHSGRSELAYSRFLAFGPYFDMDRQWRLFRPADVSLETGLHTAGIITDKGARATPGAYILHFDWVLRTLARRRQKAANYEAQAEKARHYRHYVLYEMIPEEWHQFETLDDPRFRDFARKIYHASS
jgi:hypothetical protein